MDGYRHRGSTAQATARARAWLLVGRCGCWGNCRRDRAGRRLTVEIKDLLFVLEFTLGLAAFAGLVVLLLLGFSLLAAAVAGIA